MINAWTHLLVWLNQIANTLGRWLLAPCAVLPGWLSATIAAAVTGILLLVVFKYTSNQRAIKRVRDSINANLLGLRLFKDNVSVAIRAQGMLMLGAVQLFVLALAPMVVMALPVTLVLGQLSLWYQQRPLHVDEEAVVTVRLNGAADANFPTVRLQPSPAVEPMLGPVRILSQREVCWNIRAREPGYHELRFQVGDQIVDKTLAIGSGFMHASAQRPGWSWTDILLYPAEQPFGPDSVVHSITIDYPPRPTWMSGTDTWVIYWFLASMVAALCFRRVLKVQV